MQEFLKMDIFFVVATIAFAVVGILLAIAIVYLVRFLRTLDRIAENVEEETEAIRHDIAGVRSRVKEEGAKLGAITEFFGKTARRIVKKKKK